MIRFLLIVLVVPFNLAAQSFTPDSTAAFVAYWNKGEEKILNISTSREKYKDDQLENKRTGRYKAHVRITDSTENEYTLSWTYREVSTADNLTKADDQLAALTEGLTVIYKTDELGSFKELVNWMDIRTYIETAVNNMNASRSMNGKNLQVIEQVRTMFASRQSIEAVAIRDIQLYHSPFGGEYMLHQKNVFETSLTNVFGGEPFPALLSTELVGINSTANTCTLISTQHIDQTKASLIMREAVSKLSPSGDGQLPRVEINDKNNFVLFIETGWLKSASYERTIVIDNQRQIDRLEIVEQ